MTKEELENIVFEYTNAVEAIKDTSWKTYEVNLQIYNMICEMKTNDPTKKEGVVYQNDFINELYKDFLENERQISTTVDKLRKWCSKLIRENKDIIVWEDLPLYSGKDSFEILRNNWDILPNKIYWTFVGESYTCSDLGHSDSKLIDEYLSDTRPAKEHLMTEEEREYFNNLPEELTIYRGCTKKEINSGNFRCSWTLDKKVAEFFAFEYINRIFEDGGKPKDKSLYDIVEKTVNKKDLLCYFGGRDEAEVLYIPTK
jgi:hypothetical protein